MTIYESYHILFLFSNNVFTDYKKERQRQRVEDTILWSTHMAILSSCTTTTTTTTTAAAAAATITTIILLVIIMVIGEILTVTLPNC